MALANTSCSLRGFSDVPHGVSPNVMRYGGSIWCPSPRTRQSDKVSNYCGTIVLANSETDRRPGRLALYWNVDNAVGTDLFDRVWHDRYPEPCRHERHDRRNLRGFLSQDRAKSRTLATCYDAVVETGPDCPELRLFRSSTSVQALQAGVWSKSIQLETRP